VLAGENELRWLRLRVGPTERLSVTERTKKVVGRETKERFWCHIEREKKDRKTSPNSQGKSDQLVKSGENHAEQGLNSPKRREKHAHSPARQKRTTTPPQGPEESDKVAHAFKGGEKRFRTEPSTATRKGRTNRRKNTRFGPRINTTAAILRVFGPPGVRHRNNRTKGYVKLWGGRQEKGQQKR